MIWRYTEMTPRTAALRNALENILTEVDGKADASREPGEEREQPNDYMRIQGEADAALAEVQKLERALSEITRERDQLHRCVAELQREVDTLLHEGDDE